MTKTSIRKDIESKFGKAGFLNLTQIAEYLGSGVHEPRKLMEGCPYFRRGKNAKYYAVDDLIDRVIERRTYA
jgi:hypothetical protein